MGGMPRCQCSLHPGMVCGGWLWYSVAGWLAGLQGFPVVAVMAYRLAKRPCDRGRGAAGAVACLVLSLTAVPYAMGGLGLSQMMQLLDERGVGGTSTTAVEGAMEGLIRSLDPVGRICSAEEAGRIRSEWMGAGVAASNAGVVAAFESWPEGISYLKVKGLYAGGGAEILGHLRTLASGTGVILDLRGTDGTDLDAVVALASPFHEAGAPLFRVEGLSGSLLEMRVATEAAPLECPVMALIDHDTRCAAETLAALWSGKKGVMLIGESTRGDARIRDLLPLPDGRFVYMATKRLAPAGGSYESQGVRPDVAVQVGNSGPTPLVYAPGNGRPLSVKSKEDRDLMMRVDGDPVLRRSTDILLALRALQDHGRR